MKIPNEWLAGGTVLTAAQVKKMEPGSRVCVHQCYGRRGEHLWVYATIVQSGNKKKLAYRDYQGLSVYKDIVTRENIAYTLIKEDGSV